MRPAALLLGLAGAAGAAASPGTRHAFGELPLNREGRWYTREAGITAGGEHRLWTRKFHWNLGDTGTEDWIPSGITDLPDGRLLVAWRFRPDGPKGYRVSVVDLTDPENIRYRHVLLVRPVAGPRGFEPLRTPSTNRAGGIARIGDELFLGSYERGIEVFRLGDLFEAEGDPTKTLCGRVNGAPYALNYRYYLVRRRQIPATDLEGRWASWLARDDQGRLVSASGSNYPRIDAAPSPGRDAAPAELTWYHAGISLQRRGWQALPRLSAYGYQKWGVASRGGRSWVVARRSDGWRLLEHRESGERPLARPWHPDSRDLYLTPDGAELWSVTAPARTRFVFATPVAPE